MFKLKISLRSEYLHAKILLYVCSCKEMPQFNFSAWCLSERHIVSLANPMLFPCKIYALRLQTICFSGAKIEVGECNFFLTCN